MLNIRGILDGCASVSVVMACAVVVSSILSRGGTDGVADGVVGSSGVPRPQQNSAVDQDAPSAQDVSREAIVTTAGNSSLDMNGSKLVLIEFSDFECPYCRRHAGDAFQRLKSEFVDTGKIQYVFRHFPLEAIHPSALRVAEAAECARAQGRFWDMHDRLFGDLRPLGVPTLIDHATRAGLDEDAFKKCLSGSMTRIVRQDLMEGTRLGVRGTPTFFVGQLKSDGTVAVLRRIAGAVPYATFEETLTGMLSALASS